MTIDSIQIQDSLYALRYPASMSDRPRMSKRDLLDWLKGSGALVITVLGLLFYFILSVPETVFYSRLGTSPNEVGIAYASLLSGSAAGAVRGDRLVRGCFSW
jgi:hypothetical protein